MRDFLDKIALRGCLCSMLVAAEDFRSKKPVWFDVEIETGLVAKCLNTASAERKTRGGKNNQPNSAALPRAEV